MTLNIGSVYLEIYLAKVQIEWPTGPLSMLNLTKDSQLAAELKSNKPAASSKSFLARHRRLSPPVDVWVILLCIVRDYYINKCYHDINNDNDEDNNNGGDGVNDDDADDDADGDYDDYMIMMSIMVFLFTILIITVAVDSVSVGRGEHCEEDADTLMLLMIGIMMMIMMMTMIIIS